MKGFAIKAPTLDMASLGEGGEKKMGVKFSWQEAIEKF